MSGYWWYITVSMKDGDLPRGGSEEVLFSAAEISGSIGSEPQELPNGTRMRIYYRADEEINVWRGRLLDALREWEGVTIEDVGKIENQPWHTQSQDAFPPLSVGKRLVVLAPWHRGTEPQKRIPVYINPGSAFGTGYHESTQTALELLEHHLASGGSAESVVDVGTGSGILSIAAIKLGASHALARDIDPAVTDEVSENMQLNGVDASRMTVETGDLLSGVSEKFDLLFANILLELNIALLPSVAGVLRPGGAAIFSGMTSDESERFLAALASTPLRVVEQTTKGDWWGVRAEGPAR